MNAEIGVTSSQESHDRWLDKPVFGWWPALTIEKLLIVLIIAITLLTRFYDLGARTMSHDEVNHVVPSYTIETYVYDPVTHGPFQFHAIAFLIFSLGIPTSVRASRQPSLAWQWWPSPFLRGSVTLAGLAR